MNCWTIFTLLVSFIIALPMLGVAEETFFTPTTMFWLYNLAYFLFNDLFRKL